MNKATLYAIDSCFSDTKTNWNITPPEFGLGHLGIKMDDVIYGFRPHITELQTDIVECKVREDTKFFQEAKKFVPIYSLDCSITKKSKKIILNDYQKQIILPYCLFPNNKQAYNCVSYLRDKAELHFYQKLHLSIK